MDFERAAQLAGEIAETLNRRDPDRFLARVHRDFEGCSALVQAEGGQMFRGVDGARAWFDNLLEVYERLRASVEQTVAVGRNALHLVRIEFVGRGSGVAIEALVAWVIEAREDRIVFMHSHLDLAEAFDEMSRRVAELH
ncbi:MAG: nuclear transport factor 2 family protein [Actinomycetota bacterium]|nr:nuclear transport factor 2 family protein [Actinomycetota bacterium]